MGNVDFAILQRGVVGKGNGSDTYVISNNLVQDNAKITLSDSGLNTLHLIDGLEIASSKVAANALLLTLSNGAEITVLDAANYEFVVGGDPITGETGTSYNLQGLASNVLGVEVPSSGIASGGNATLGQAPSSSTDIVIESTMDTLVVQRGITGKGSGHDTYVLSNDWIEAGSEITITDTGENTIQFIDGLEISSSMVARNAMKLTLASGGTVIVLDASDYTYVVGGNPLLNEEGTQLGFEEFAAQILNVEFPVGSKISNGDSSVINEYLLVPAAEIVAIDFTEDFLRFDGKPRLHGMLLGDYPNPSEASIDYVFQMFSFQDYDGDMPVNSAEPTDLIVFGVRFDLEQSEFGKISAKQLGELYTKFPAMQKDRNFYLQVDDDPELESFTTLNSEDGRDQLLDGGFWHELVFIDPSSEGFSSSVLSEGSYQREWKSAFSSQHKTEEILALLPNSLHFIDNGELKFWKDEELYISEEHYNKALSRYDRVVMIDGHYQLAADHEYQVEYFNHNGSAFATALLRGRGESLLFEETAFGDVELSEPVPTLVLFTETDTGSFQSIASKPIPVDLYGIISGYQGLTPHTFFLSAGKVLDAGAIAFAPQNVNSIEYFDNDGTLTLAVGSWGVVVQDVRFDTIHSTSGREFGVYAGANQDDQGGQIGSYYYIDFYELDEEGLISSNLVFNGGEPLMEDFYAYQFFVEDFSGDGLVDILIYQSTRLPKIFTQDENGDFTEDSLAAVFNLEQFPDVEDAKHDYYLDEWSDDEWVLIEYPGGQVPFPEDAQGLDVTFYF